jgi:hypothetical protein
MTDGEYGADRWYEHHKLTVARLRELIAIMNDSNVPDGSLIRLRQDYAPSHSNRALRARGDLARRSLGHAEMPLLSSLMEEI